ncbi:MAG: NAD(P)H-dependent oxidoreductase, partial [Oscillospiraceae bacterium]|nr:NAD(P)H-dependent oxidoreductase [Oscillospiraceae bacterium]
MMKKVLYVDCCIRGGLSRTAQLAEAFLNHLPKEYEVQTLKLDEENLSAFSGAFFAQRERLLEEGELHHPRFRYANQFAEADLI